MTIEKDGKQEQATVNNSEKSQDNTRLIMRIVGAVMGVSGGAIFGISFLKEKKPRYVMNMVKIGLNALNQIRPLVDIIR